MAAKAEEMVQKLSKRLIVHPYPMLHGFRNCVPAPFSSYAWREFAYESVRQTARESKTYWTAASGPNLDPLSVLWRRAGQTKYGFALRNLRRCQRFIAWSLFCLMLTTEKKMADDAAETNDREDGGKTTTNLQNTLFFAMWMFVVAWVWSHVEASTALYEQAGTNYQPRPTIAWTALMLIIAFFMLHGAAKYDADDVHENQSGNATARTGMIVVATHVIVCICLDWAQPGPTDVTLLKQGEAGDYDAQRDNTLKQDKDVLV